MIGLSLVSLVPFLFSVFFTTLFILIVLELKAIARSLSNIERYLSQSNSKNEGTSKDIHSKIL